MQTFEKCKRFRFSGMASVLARSLPELTVEQRVTNLLGLFGQRTIVTTSFGTTSAVLLHLASRVLPNVTVLNIRHGHETESTLAHMEACARKMPINLVTVEAPHLPIPAPGTTEFDRFQQTTKVRPLRGALADHGAWFWLSGLMHDELESRESLEMARVRYGTVAIYPILDWSREQALDYCLENDLPVNNDYFDPCKGANQSMECGLHYDHVIQTG